jgi:hypothetical protein
MSKYNQYTINRFIKVISNYNLYFSNELKTWWWINPSNNDWLLELDQNDYCIWYNFHWGNTFKLTLSLSDQQFFNLIYNYNKFIIENIILPPIQNLEHPPQHLNIKNNIVNHLYTISGDQSRDIKQILDDDLIVINRNTSDILQDINHIIYQGINYNENIYLNDILNLDI